MAKAITKAQKKKNLDKARALIADNKTVTIDRKAIIDIPVIGSFRDYISETLNYILSSHDEKDVIVAMGHIQNNFKDLKEDAPYDPLLSSIWCLMTLINEINHQAAEQGKTYATDKKLNETMSDLINNVEHAPNNNDNEALLKETLKEYKSKIPGDIKFGNSEGDYDAEHKGKTSSED